MWVSKVQKFKSHGQNDAWPCIYQIIQLKLNQIRSKCEQYTKNSVKCSNVHVPFQLSFETQ